jgi:hypothetical protein
VGAEISTSEGERISVERLVIKQDDVRQSTKARRYNEGKLGIQHPVQKGR